MNITILYGGKSTEHEVSLQSASSVVRNIDREHIVHLIGISKENRFFLQPESERERILNDESALLTIDESNEVFLASGGGRERAFFTKTQHIVTDVVFPVMHGSFGEDGVLQGLLEMLQIPYVGSGVLGSAAAMDKEKTKIIWRANGLPIVPFVSVLKEAWHNELERKKIISHAERDLEYPIFVKPSNAGSSVGVSIAKNQKDLFASIDAAFKWDEKVLLEMFIYAREIECSVTGNEKLTAYIPGEIVSSHDFYDYDAKYLDPNGARLEIPADLTVEQRKTVRSLALKAYTALELKGFARVDFFIDKRNGNIYLNEVNTIPGFTVISMFPKMCVASGMPYGELITHLLTLAIERFKEKAELHRSR